MSELDDKCIHVWEESAGEIYCADCSKYGGQMPTAAEFMKLDAEIVLLRKERDEAVEDYLEVRRQLARAREALKPFAQLDPMALNGWTRCDIQIEYILVARAAVEAKP